MRLYHNIIFRVSNLLKAIVSCQVLISTSDEENSESILSIDADTLSSCWTTSGSIEMQTRSPTCGRNHRLSLFSRQKLTNRDLGNEESHIFTRTRLLLCLVRQSLTLRLEWCDSSIYGDGYCDAVKTTKIVSSIDFYISKQRERFTRFRFWGIYDIVSTDLRLFCHFLWTGFIFEKVSEIKLLTIAILSHWPFQCFSSKWNCKKGVGSV